MKLAEAKSRLEAVINRPFRELFTGTNYDWVINKGKAGQALEIVLGLHNTPNPLDFSDGELKTNKCDSHGNPRETVFISQILSVIDDMFLQKPFEESHLCEKISNILYVPVCKDGNPRDWMFLSPIHIDLNKPEFARLRQIWRDDYYSICSQLKHHVETSSDGFIHTSNGQHIKLEVRILSHITLFIREFMVALSQTRIMHSIFRSSSLRIYGQWQEDGYDETPT